MSTEAFDLFQTVTKVVRGPKTVYYRSINKRKPTMSNQHPLTDDTIRYVKKLGCHDLGTWIYTENDLRAAYDLGRDEGHAEMLEAVSRWTKRHAWSYVEQCQYEDDHEFNDSKFIAHLKQAMRPTQEDS